ncbi:BMP family lipoprotein [Phosphitispora sp. TUW77]|uniref:BMP family lipoprotein n=1 Tax=Phosphitispora sp. TUW77 TaxID=3152361 RepID=UPI003AB14C24
MALKRVGIFGLLLAVIFVIGGCSGENPSKDEEYKQYGSLEPTKIGVVLGSGENTGGINAAVDAGVKELAVEQSLEYKTMSPGDLVNNAETISYLAENGYDIIIAVGQEFENDLDLAAPQYPDTAFAVVQGEVDQPNVLSMKIDDNEGLFLAGAAAALLTKTNFVGFVGGEMTGTSQEKAFARGVHFINLAEGKQVKVISVFTGMTKQAFIDPQQGKELGQKLFDAGIDVVFTPAGNFGAGLAGAAAEKKKIALTNDRQLMEKMPWNVFGAVVQKPENAVYTALAGILENSVLNGKMAYGIKEGSVDFVLSQAVSLEIKNKLNSIKEQFKNNQINTYTVQIPEGLIIKLNEFFVNSTNPAVKEIIS